MNHDVAPIRTPSVLLDTLNPEQRAAVTLPPVPALILAGAGSGKTRVLTTRMAWLLHTGQASPAGLMAVTFTNKAAKEMLTRLSAMLPVNVRGMWIGTFHGLCHRFLRAHWKLADLAQGFQILDAQDTVAAVRRVIKRLNVDEDRFAPKAMAGLIAQAKEQGQRSQDMEVRDAATRTQAQIYAAYEAQCQRDGVVDFAELLLRSYELMRDHPELRAHYQDRFSHILVDEFQDTNKLQYAWLKMFSRLPGPEGTANRVTAVLAVGDDDQSIYAFRGAQVGNMAQFQQEFQVREVIKLERNYRSCGHILEAANALISHNEHRLGKNLRTQAGAGEPVRVYEAASDTAEALWLVDEIRQLHRCGVARSDMAVLYRSNAQSRVIESALFNAAIPYRVYGGLRFFERAEIKHALAYLRLIENPHDDTSFLRVLNFPARGIGSRTVEQLQEAAQRTGRSLVQSVGAVSGKAGSNLAAFCRLIDSMREAVAQVSLRESIEHVIDASTLREHYRAEKEGQDRLENLDELVTAAQAFSTQALEMQDAETGEVISPLSAFLTHAALEAGDNQARDGQEAVQLMTVHAAKGLEFDAVFITGMEEGLCPHDNALNDVDGLEEERRLMYVAITRARQRLYLSFAQTRMLHGQTRYKVSSRFFDELPEEVLKWLTPRRRAGAWAGGGAGSDAGPATRSPRYESAGFRGGAVAKSAPTVSSGSGGVRQRGGWSTGQSVFHPKFGEGLILALEGDGEEARAQVNFGRHGVKWLALAVAKLQPIASA